MIRWFFCLVRLHNPPRGTNDRLCIYWHCTRCDVKVFGALGQR